VKSPIEFLTDTWYDICLAADSMGPTDWALFIVAGILEIAFVVTIVMLVSAY